mmetsp:Transcript_17574/g.21473  ORF Transcript_17574/g.21473 Transcript_17574/m.21473 type:complete len:459 (+) Transcript_17574:159-1535(+)
MLDQCSETCGWVAGIIAALSFGSFGVPIKSVSKVKVDPLVMQSYKSLLCFITCWFVIPLGEPCRFTPWGLVSGLFWVPGATAGIYGIRNAGLAISVGTWSSLIVISSFCWGIVVFGESVKSKRDAGIAALILIIGLVGMSIYSAPVNSDVHASKSISTVETSGIDINFNENNDATVENVPLLKTSKSNVSSNSLQSYSSDENNREIELTKMKSNSDISAEVTRHTNKTLDDNADTFTMVKRRKNILEGDDTLSKIPQEQLSPTEDLETAVNAKGIEKEDELVHFGGKFSLSKRQLGIMGAIINGIWGSNNMIPMHYARAQGFYGAGYLISYSVGSMIITIILWFIRYLYNLYHYGDHRQAYNALPSFHCRQMCLPGALAGFLYSLGNFCSIITVTALGQGVGYSFVQTSMLISGLWGIFYFEEVQGSDRICKWLGSSIVTIIGILLLSYEHVGSSAAH